MLFPRHAGMLYYYISAAQKLPPPMLFAAGTSDQTKFVEAVGISAPFDCVAMNQQNALRLGAAEEK